MKIKILLILCISFFSTVSNADPLDSIQEVTLLDNPKYIGYRIALANISISSTKTNDELKIEYTAINTGRQDLLFGKKIAPPPQLVVHFDESLQNNNLGIYAADIRAALMHQDFHIAAGEISQRNSIKITTTNTPQAIDAATEAIVEETSIIENPRLEKPISETKEKETLTAKSVPVDDFENSLAGAAHRQYDKDACSDLIFESITIVKKSKNKVTLKYTIYNQGEGPATLITNRKKTKQNMALQAYMSSKDQVTKSSFSFDGDFIGKGLEKSNGRLYPGERYTNTIKLNIQKMTTFTPYIILELDPYLAVYECDKKNNKFAVKVGEGEGLR